MQSSRVLAAVAILTLTCSAYGQEKVENPEFASWAKFKKGTSVKMLSVTAVQGFAKTEQATLTSTLIELGAEKLVIETTVTMPGANGGVASTATSKREIPKTVPVPQGEKEKDFLAGKPLGTTKEGEETIKVGAVEIKTKCYEFTTEIGGVKTTGKWCLSDEVPGRVVKIEEGMVLGVPVKTTVTLIEIKKP